MVTLSELVKLDIPDLEHGENGEVINQAEVIFLEETWNVIKESADPFMLYFNLMHHFVQLAQTNREFPFLSDPQVLTLMDAPVFDDGERGDKKFPRAIRLSISETHIEEQICQEFIAIWKRIEQLEPTDLELNRTSVEWIDFLATCSEEIRRKHIEESGSILESPLCWRNERNVREILANYIVNGINLSDNKEGHDEQRQATYRRLLLDQWRRSSGSSPRAAEQGQRQRVRELVSKLKKILDGLSDEQNQLRTYMVVRDYVEAMDRYTYPFGIMSYYRRNHTKLIADRDEINNEHRKILYEVLISSAVGFVKKKFSEDNTLKSTMDAFFITSYFNLRLDSYLDFKEREFKFSKNEKIRIAEILIQEVERFLFDHTFTNKINSKRYKGTNLSKLRIQTLETHSSSLDWYHCRMPYFIWDSKELALKDRSVQTPLDSFVFSETGFDLHVYSPDMRYKYDFAERRVYQFDKSLSRFEQVYDYYNNSRKNKGLEGFQFYLEKGFSHKNGFDHVNFRSNWKGFYYCSIEKDELELLHCMTTFKNIGSGFGLARADGVIAEQYLWLVENITDQERIEKLGTRLGLALERNLNGKVFQLVDAKPKTGFIHEIIEYKKDKYVRTNLPYVNLEDVKTEIEDDAKNILNQIKLRYYRRVEEVEPETYRIVKSDYKNLPFEHPHLPVCFEIPQNYKFLHRNQFVEGRTKIKWLDKVQRKRKTLESSKEERENLHSVMGESATRFTVAQFQENQSKREIWQVIKSPFQALPTDQEWCHMQGHGDGGPDIKENIVAGSKHCNTEQLAIELGQRRTTHQTLKNYKLNSTVYFFSRSATNRIEGGKRKNSSDDDVMRSKKKKKDSGGKSIDKEISELPELNDDHRIAAFIRYKIYRGRKKIFDYTFEGQGEFFDRNMFQIINRVAEFTLRGEDDFKRWLGLTL